MAELFDDGVVAVGEEALAHGVGVFFVGEGAELDVEELVLGLLTDGYGVAAFLQGGERRSASSLWETAATWTMAAALGAGAAMAGGGVARVRATGRAVGCGVAASGWVSGMATGMSVWGVLAVSVGGGLLASVRGGGLRAWAWSR